MGSFKASMLRLVSTASVVSVLMGGNAGAEEMVLSSWLPPKHPIVTGVIEPWAAAVENVTEGRVTVRILPRPLGPPPAHFDLVADGIADIAYGLHSFTNDDRFTRSRIGEFSFLGDDAAMTSKAYWNVYTGELDAQAEHEGTHLLSLWVHGPGMFHNNQRVVSDVDDFAGLKIRVPGGYIAELTRDLGATTQFMGPGEVFEKLSTGVIDGATFPAEALKAFNLSQHITHTMTVPGGFYNTSWFLVINEDRWADISEQDQDAIDAISGATLAETAGQVWNAADAGGLADAAAAGVVFTEASENVMSKLAELAAAAEARWSDDVSAQGYDGMAALAKLRALATP